MLKFAYLKWYKDYLLAVDLREETKKAYLYEVNKFITSYKSTEVTNKVLSEYIENLLPSLHPTTINRTIASLNNFISAININFNKRLKNLKPINFIYEHKHIAVTENDFFEAISRINISQKNAQRDIILLKLCYYAGLRTGELVNLTKRDLFFNGRICEYTGLPLPDEKTFDRMFIYIQNGKGGKNRRITVSNREFNISLCKFVKNLTEHDYIFKSQKGGKLTVRAIQHILSKLNLSPNILRHTYATRRIRPIIKEIRDVQSNMGHSSFDTTKLYIDKENV